MRTRLGQLLRRGRGQLRDELLTSERPSPEAASPARAPFSIWARIKDDAGAAALRAEWEARWDAY